MKGFKVFILTDPCFIQCVMYVVRNLLTLPGEFYSSHIQLSVSILRGGQGEYFIYLPSRWEP